MTAETIETTEKVQGTAEESRLRTYARRLLIERMGDISENHYAAGWMSGLEQSLWRGIQSTEPYRYGQGVITAEDIADLRQLALDAGGWPDPRDGDNWNEAGDEWVPLSDMPRVMAEYYASVGYDAKPEEYASWPPENAP